MSSFKKAESPSINEKPHIQLGKRIASFLEDEGRRVGCDNETMLGLLLAITYGWAERAGLDPKKDPRPLFERAARQWDAQSRDRIVSTVDSLSPSELRSLVTPRS